MTTKDLYDNIKVVQSVASAVQSGNGTTTTGSWIDTAGYESVTVVWNVGTAGDVWGAGLYYTFQISESDAANGANPATATAVSTAIPILDLAADHQSKSYKQGYFGTKRYIAAEMVRTGNHVTGTPIGATVILGHARRKPVA